MSRDEFDDAADLPSGPVDAQLVERVKELLAGDAPVAIDGLADRLNVAPKHVRHALASLRAGGYRIPEFEPGRVVVDRLAPGPANTIRKLPLQLLDGDVVRFGVVSDTHLCSVECALDELHLAYDWFEREEIDTVLHPGDLVAGMGIFKNQHLYITHHSYEGQRAFAVENYPKREGITTRIIGGNHDLEGDFGKAGADPVQGVASERPDIDYLGPYSAFAELPNGAYVHLLHGAGGMSYSFSYKMQKIIEGYAAGRKPAALLLGHFHVQANLEVRGVQGMYPACFEWVSVQFGVRHGHRNSVGFHVVEARLGEDGSVTEWTARWKPLWEGRRVG